MTDHEVHIPVDAPARSARRRRGGGRSGLVLYAIVLAVTFGINIPLNDELDRAGDPDRISDLAQVRDRFEGPWVAANIVRTLGSTAAVAALARALFLHGHTPADPTRSIR